MSERIEKDAPMVEVRPPQWQWTWNLNTVVILLGFASGIAAWGATWERTTASATENARRIDGAVNRIANLEITSRLLDNHELRITSMEQNAARVAETVRSMEALLGDLRTDIRVTREIVQRLENNQGGIFTPPRQ